MWKVGDLVTPKPYHVIEAYDGTRHENGTIAVVDHIFRAWPDMIGVTLLDSAGKIHGARAYFDGFTRQYLYSGEIAIFPNPLGPGDIARYSVNGEIRAECYAREWIVGAILRKMADSAVLEKEPHPVMIRRGKQHNDLFALFVTEPDYKRTHCQIWTIYGCTSGPMAENIHNSKPGNESDVKIALGLMRQWAPNVNFVPVIQRTAATREAYNQAWNRLQAL